jgi:hypothetical protein
MVLLLLLLLLLLFVVVVIVVVVVVVVVTEDYKVKHFFHIPTIERSGSITLLHLIPVKMRGDVNKVA